MSKVKALAAMLAIWAGAAAPAHADHIDLVKKDKVEGKCNEAGGTYWGTSASGSYGCLNPDGSGIVCGGAKPGCDRWPATRAQTKAHKLTRAEARKTYGSHAAH